MRLCSLQTSAQHDKVLNEVEMHLCCLGNRTIPVCGLAIDSQSSAAFPANVLGYAMPFYPSSLKDHIL